MICPDFPFVDLAVGGVDRRNNPVPIGEVRARVNGSADSYITVHRFPEEFRRHVHDTGSVRGWAGSSWADYLAWDIDRDPDKLDEARRATMALGHTLIETYGVGQDQLRIFFSGRKGFHVLLPTELLGPLTPSPELARLLKDLALAIASEAGVEVDEKIYDRTRLFRIPNTPHSGSGLYKVELSWDELVNQDAVQIQELAGSPREFEWSPDHLESLPALEALLERVAEREPESTTTKVADPVEGRIPGPPNGRRDSTLTSLGGTMRRRGMEEPEIRAALLEINRRRCDPPLQEAQVEKIAASVSRYDPNPDALPEGDESPQKGPRIPEPVSMAELLAMEVPDERYHIEELIEHDSNVLVAAAPKSHKTNFALHLAVAGCAGRSILGAFPVPDPLRFGMVLMEDRPHRVRRRIERMARSEGIDPHDLDGRLFTWYRPPLRLDDLKAIQDLGDYVERFDLDVLVIDSYAYVSVGDSNSSDEVTPQLSTLSALRNRRPGLCIVLIVHAGKHQEHRGDRVTDIIRGSGAFGAWYDTGILLTRKDEHAPVSVRVEHRDLPSPEPFAFTVDDEFPGPQPSGYLRLRRSEKSAEQLLREKNGEKLAPELKEKLGDHPAGVSRRELRNLLDAPRRDVEAAFEVLRTRGEAVFTPSPGKGRAARYSLTVPGVP